mmetsp:Transcript_11877/g.27339  ORF Transcript_11877/g.27339 Transcript_11877/m.27339 type:complete len:223 (-) Transcript_11877:535-1203(-)
MRGVLEVLVHLPPVEQLLDVVQEDVHDKRRHKHDHTEKHVELEVRGLDAVGLGHEQVRVRPPHNPDQERRENQRQSFGGVARDKAHDLLDRGPTSVVEIHHPVVLVGVLVLEVVVLLLPLAPLQVLGPELLRKLNALEHNLDARVDVHAHGHEDEELNEVRSDEIEEVVGTHGGRELDEHGRDDERSKEERLAKEGLESLLKHHVPYVEHAETSVDIVTEEV